MFIIGIKDYTNNMNSALFKTLLILSYGPSVFLVTFALMVSPLWTTILFVEPSSGLLGVVMLLLCGLSGLRGVVLLLTLDTRHIDSRALLYRLVIYLLLGIGASLFASIGLVSLNWALSLVLFLPVPATLYLIYLNRNHFYRLVCG